MNTQVAPTANPKAKRPLLTKAGIIILTISLLLSAICFVTGFLQIDKEGEPNYNNGNNGNDSYNDGYNNNRTTLTLNFDSSKYLSYYSGETIDLEFSSSSNYSVYFYTYGVDILSIEDSYGNSISYYEVYNDRSSSYDECYCINTSSYTTYTITVNANYSSPSVYLTTNY
jgi:hypothetical protein